MSDKVTEQNLKILQSKVEHIEQNTFEKEPKSLEQSTRKLSGAQPAMCATGVVYL